MSNINNGGPAFPVPDPFLLSPSYEDDMRRIASGMNLRDYFAAKAMQSYLTRSDSDEFEALAWAKAAYAMADAMIHAREE